MPLNLTTATVAVGDQAPVLTHTLSRTDLVRYAGASGDYNPMHHDEPKAVAARQPSVFGHGMLSMGIVGTALTHYVGVGALQTFSVRFARQTWPGEELSTEITVTAIDGNVATLEVKLRNGGGEEKVVGQATALLGAA